VNYGGAVQGGWLTGVYVVEVEIEVVVVLRQGCVVTYCILVGFLEQKFRVGGDCFVMLNA